MPDDNFVSFRELTGREKDIRSEIMADVRTLIQEQGISFTKTLESSLREFGHDLAEKMDEIREDDRERLRQSELDIARIAERQKMLEEITAKHQRRSAR